MQAHVRVVLDQRVVQRGRLDLAAGEADDQDPALERDALGGPGVRVAADRVVDHVGAAALGDLLDHLDEVLGGPVDHHVRAQEAGHLGLLAAAGHADDPGAGRLAQLDRAAADAARGGVHEQGLAGRQPGAPVQPEPPGLVRDEEGGCLGVVQAVRGGQRGGRVHQRQLGEGAAGSAAHWAADEPVAGRDPGHPRAGRHDLAAQLDARGERQRRADLVAAAAHEHVGEVRRGAEHPHQYLAGPWHRVGDLGQRQHVPRLAQLGYLPSPHAIPRSTSSIRCCIRFIPRSHLSVSPARSW